VWEREGAVNVIDRQTPFRWRNVRFFTMLQAAIEHAHMCGNIFNFDRVYRVLDTEADFEFDYECYRTFTKEEIRAIEHADWIKYGF
jgi:hypothetical protein